MASDKIKSADARRVIGGLMGLRNPPPTGLAHKTRWYDCRIYALTKPMRSAGGQAAQLSALSLSLRSAP
jgi:hypothetical protein